MTTPPAIEVDGLTKRFGALTAVDGVRLTVPRGSVYGFLGPNGSGKTTTLGMITGLIPPDGGTARVEGIDVRAAPSAALGRVGALVEEPAFYPYLTGRQNLALVARLRGLASPDEEVDRALLTSGMAEAAGARYRGYSLGMRRRLGIAACLLGNPPVLILDEPTNGLDPAGQVEVRRLLAHVAKQGRTVLVSSHLLHEVQEVCTHVAIIHRGRVLSAGPMREILSSSEEILVEVDDPVRAQQILMNLTGVRGIVVTGHQLQLEASHTLSADVNRLLVQAGVRVSLLERVKPALESRFLQMTEGERR